jgi:hypothetical protein
MNETVVLLSKPPKYQLEVPPWPISYSATIGPVFFNDVQHPKAPLILSSFETNKSIFPEVDSFNSLVSLS